MAFNKVVLFAAFAACIIAIQAAEPSPVNPIPEGISQPEPQQKEIISSGDTHGRDKKFAVFSSYAYQYPAAYYGYPAVSSYAYTYPKTYPYAYSAYYHALPSYHYVL